jgi:hypothetical protein
MSVGSLYGLAGGSCALDKARNKTDKLVRPGGMDGVSGTGYDFGLTARK